jgi:hypothetical protein
MSAYATWMFCHENVAAYEYILDYGKFLMPTKLLKPTVDKLTLLSL